MPLIDFITNIAALLLWLTSRSLRFDPLAKTSAASLIGTLKRAEPRRLRSWQLLLGVAAVITLRSVLYVQIGSAANWVPHLDFRAVVLAFRADHFTSALLFSVASFLRILLVFYLWLLILAAINHKASEPEPIQKVLRLHLGRAAGWPWPIQVLLPLFLATACWAAFHPLLVHTGVLTRTKSFAHILEQGLLIGVGLYCSLEYLLPPLLLVYLVASYVFLGNNPLWDFVSSTARSILGPLKGIPLNVGKYDFAPLVGAVLLLLLLHWLPNEILSLAGRNRVNLWPQ
jgi:uncharacterized protein YggT (Ycf19 family)